MTEIIPALFIAPPQIPAETFKFRSTWKTEAQIILHERENSLNVISAIRLALTIATDQPVTFPSALYAARLDLAAIVNDVLFALQNVYLGTQFGSVEFHQDCINRHITPLFSEISC